MEKNGSPGEKASSLGAGQKMLTGNCQRNSLLSVQTLTAKDNVWSLPEARIKYNGEISGNASMLPEFCTNHVALSACDCSRSDGSRLKAQIGQGRQITPLVGKPPFGGFSFEPENEFSGDRWQNADAKLRCKPAPSHATSNPRVFYAWKPFQNGAIIANQRGFVKQFFRKQLRGIA